MPSLLNNQNADVLVDWNDNESKFVVYHETRRYYFDQDRLDAESAPDSVLRGDLYRDVVPNLQALVLRLSQSHGGRLYGSLLTIPELVDGVALLILILISVRRHHGRSVNTEADGIVLILVCEGAMDVFLLTNRFRALYRLSFWLHFGFLIVYYLWFWYFGEALFVWLLLGLRTLVEGCELWTLLQLDAYVHDKLVAEEPSYVGSKIAFLGWNSRCWRTCFCHNQCSVFDMCRRAGHTSLHMRKIPLPCLVFSCGCCCHKCDDWVDGYATETLDSGEDLVSCNCCSWCLPDDPDDGQPPPAQSPPPRAEQQPYQRMSESE